MTAQKRSAANTATGAAMMKALEADTPAGERLFDDAVLARLLPAPARALLATGPVRRWLVRAIERSNPGLFGGFVLRTRHLDEVTRRAVRDGATSFVVLGAGFDTRAYRLPELGAARVFEVDQGEVVRKKRAALARAGVPSERVTFVPIDFESEDVAERLAAAGWDRASRTLFLLEGVTQYVAREGVLAVLRFAAKAAPGSEVAFTYVPIDVIEGRSKRMGIEVSRRFVSRRIWVTGFDPETLRSELAALGLDLVEDVGAAEYEARYLAPIGRKLPVFEIERIAVAVVRA
jgi:methyltransferase (TIGR00027 family)